VAASRDPDLVAEHPVPGGWQHFVLSAGETVERESRAFLRLMFNNKFAKRD
jgi:hypothetical protein